MDAAPPPRLILSTEYTCLIQSASDAILAVSIQIPLEYFADGHRLFWINYNFFIYDPISIRCGRWEKGTDLHPALTAPSHIAGDGFALLLGEGGIDGSDELAAHIGGVDALALEADIDAQLLSSRTASRQSFVFRAKREMDLTRIWSMSPLRQSTIMRWKSSRFAAEVPVIPSSAAVQKGLINSRRTGFPAQGFHQSFNLIDKVQPNVHAPVRVDGDGVQQLD